MGTRSLQASLKGIEKAKIALAQYSLSQNALAEELGLSRQTVNNFFKGKPIDRENFALICDRLNLDLENTVKSASISPNSQAACIESSEIGPLIQEVRQKVRDNIEQRCGKMRILDMSRPIDLNTIYTDVNILQEITGRQRLDLADLLERCNREEFDRVGFAYAYTKRWSGLEAVEKFDKLMLLGKPGAGKTTFLKRLAMLCNIGSFQRHRVPIFITLKDFGDSSEKPRLLTYIIQWLKDLGVQESQSAEQIFEQGRGFLLLDGLDEVSERSSKQVLQEIQTFSDRFHQNAFVISCRIAAKEFTFQKFTEVEVADFNDQQIADFASRWFQAKQLTEKTNRFVEKLEGNYRIQELATNPLLLTLLCLVFEGRTDFPANRSELYKEGLDVLLKKWDGTRSIEREQVYRELSLKRKEDMLSQLAFTTFELGNYFFKQKEAERLIETYIQNLPGAQADSEALRLDSEAVLKSIEAQHGLLVERARGIYSFSHLTFHEYFTARRIEKRDELYPVLSSHLTEKRWREVFLLTAGMVEEADSLLVTMKSQIDEIIATDDELQQFVAWIQQKSSSLNGLYKPASIRAFYLTLVPNLDRALTNVRARALDHARTLDSAIESTDILDYDLIINCPLALILDRAFSLDYDFVSDSILTLALTLACDSIHDLDSALALHSVLNRVIDPALKQLLEKLKEQLPNPQQDWNYIQQWWQINRSSWIAQLRTAMIEHRNIGHDWQFSPEQRSKLQQYYDANKLLVDCLNSDCYVSRSVREEIEASLLLPIADLEQQFPNQRRSPSSRL